MVKSTVARVLIVDGDSAENTLEILSAFQRAYSAGDTNPLGIESQRAEALFHWFDEEVQPAIDAGDGSFTDGQ